MADNLRDRIAAAIYNSCDDYTQKLLVRPDCPGASEVEGEGKPTCYILADAVIQELGLREERWTSDDPKMLRGPWTRYVTKWSHPDD